MLTQDSRGRGLPLKHTPRALQGCAMATLWEALLWSCLTGNKWVDSVLWGACHPFNVADIWGLDQGHVFWRESTQHGP